MHKLSGNPRKLESVVDEEQSHHSVHDTRQERDYRIGLPVETFLERTFQLLDPHVTVTVHGNYIHATFEKIPSLARATKFAYNGVKQYFGVVHDFFEVNPIPGGYQITILDPERKKD